MRRATKRFIILLLTFPIFLNIMSQNHKKMPTLEDLIPGGETYRYADNMYNLQWWGEKCIKPGIDTIFTINPKNGKETVIVTREKINESLKKNNLKTLQHLYDISFPWTNRPHLLISSSDKYIIYDFNNQTIIKTISFQKGGANKDFCPANEKVAYTIGNNLYIDDQAITNEPSGILCGQSVHRNEFGISKGTFWSPKGSLLAFYYMDERMVAQYPLVDITAPIGEVNNIRYPMAGMTSHQVKVGVFNPNNEKIIYLKTGDPTDRYFTNISWSPDEKSIYLIELNRDQNHAKLCQYNAETGELTATLFEEKHPKYVEPEHPITFLPWDQTKFIYQSQRDGYKHLYLYSRDGKLIKQLTKGKWLINKLLGFNTQRKEVIFTAIEGLKSGHFSVNVESGKMSQPFESSLVSAHQGILSQTGEYLIDIYSTAQQPRVIDIINTRTFKGINLLTASDPYMSFIMPTIETGTLKAADNHTDLNYRLIKPANFDPTKKYPVIVYVYGGPHAQLVTGGWLNGARGWDIYMANKGYILFTIDNRGSANRGLEFENVTFRRLGIEEGKDQVKGVEFLKSLPYVDGERIGVHGWSFGGHMTTALMLRYPNLFKVGVAGGPVIDWGYYEVMYGERYMDTPQTNPEGYKECNLKNIAGQLKGHLLMIHDDHDDTCVPQHTLSFIKACIDQRTYPDLFIYPCHHHNVMGRDRVHLHEKITRYFETYLQTTTQQP